MVLHGHHQIDIFLRFARNVANVLQTAFYHGGSTRSWTGKVIYNVFGVSDPKEHTKIWRPIGKLYNMTHALALEDHVDRAITLLAEQLETRFIDGTKCELDKWLLYCKCPSPSPKPQTYR